MVRPSRAHFGKLFVSILSAILIAGIVTLGNESIAKNPDQGSVQDTQQLNDKHVVLFEGFEPNSEVQYSILTEFGLLSEGIEMTNDKGDLALAYAPLEHDSQNYYIYDFKFTRDGDYANILLRQNLETGEITITGKGLDQFSEVSLVTSNRHSRTKTDWAGEIHASDKIDIKEDGEYQVALHGFSFMGEMGEKQSPAIIKVLIANFYGGGRTEIPNLWPIMIPTIPIAGYDVSTDRDGIDNSFPGYTINIMYNYIRALMLMTEQLSAVMMQHTAAVGQFFDAKLQLEAQRTHQQLKAEAVKDYHPSEELCRYGSYVRSLAKTEQKAVADKFILNDVMMERYKSLTNNSATTPQRDIESRLKQYREVHCNPKDNNNSLDYLCEHDQDEILTGGDSVFGAAVPDGIGGTPQQVVYLTGTFFTTRFNKDIDFTRTMDFPQTFDMDMNDAAETDDEEDVLALAKNLYWPSTLKKAQDDRQLKNQRVGFLDAKRVIALKNIAHNSYTNLAALKASAAPLPPAPPGVGGMVEPGWTFMKTLMRDFGITDLQIEQLIGVQPSYWAQMDVLTKKLYQLPDFYTNLYDKPVNVDRIGVTLDAIKLMQMRDYYQSVQRREMLNSAMLETELVRGNHYSRSEAGLLFGIGPSEPY